MLRQTLDTFRREFERTNARKIKFKKDIKAVEHEFKRYKDLTAKTAGVTAKVMLDIISKSKELEKSRKDLKDELIKTKKEMDGIQSEIQHNLKMKQIEKIMLLNIRIMLIIFCDKKK